MSSPPEHARPTWSDDQLDSSSAPEIKAPYFDNSLGAWVLTRYADVLAAFRCPSLIPTGATIKAKENKPPPDDTVRVKMRVETRAALSLRYLSRWQKRLAPEAAALAQNLPVDRTVDIVGEFARPLCLILAVAVTGADSGDANRLEDLARHVSASAADPYDSEIRALAKTAGAQLQSCFHAGPEPLRDSGFVALSHTMPCLLANAWHALLQHPQRWTQLHQRSALIPKAIEELLRYAGITRLLFRRATEDVCLNDVQFRKGDRLVLRIAVANKDPKRFPHPADLDWMHQGTGHLALGAGPHSCVGASLIRMAAITITRPLLQRFAGAEFAGVVEWRGGPVFRSPASLPVRLRESVR